MDDQCRDAARKRARRTPARVRPAVRLRIENRWERRRLLSALNEIALDALVDPAARSWRTLGEAARLGAQLECWSGGVVTMPLEIARAMQDRLEKPTP
jgi:hypothetical protein